MKNDKEYKKQIELFEKGERQINLILTIFASLCICFIIFSINSIIKMFKTMTELQQDTFWFVLFIISLVCIIFFIWVMFFLPIGDCGCEK